MSTMSWAAKCPRQHFAGKFSEAVCPRQRQTFFGGKVEPTPGLPQCTSAARPYCDRQIKMSTRSKLKTRRRAGSYKDSLCTAAPGWHIFEESKTGSFDIFTVRFWMAGGAERGQTHAHTHTHTHTHTHMHNPETHTHTNTQMRVTGFQLKET